MQPNVFTPDYKSEPYWWEKTPRPILEPPALPARIDVAIVGSGYTGLHAALQTARGGRSTLVIDSEDAGWGCSTRNGGQISTSIKPGLKELSRRFGPDKARAVLREGFRSLAWVGSFVKDEGIDCDFKVVGRFHAAHNASAFEGLVRQLRDEEPEFATGARLVLRDEQLSELGTERYHGGLVYPQHASIDPALYHQGLLDRVMSAGAMVATQTPVTAIERRGQIFELSTPRGKVTARDVVIATNGYTGTATPWHRRRVIPIGSYMIATEPLAPELMARVMPTERIVSDTRKVVYYYRPSPDHRRILFGGRVSLGETNPRISGPLLRRELVRLFPELSEVRISHSWMGFVAYTFDTLAHAGIRDGLHYAMGYCGSGVGMASYLGMRAGQRVLGKPEGQTAFEPVPFQTRPLYAGNPWFLAPSIAYYRWRDGRD